MKSVYLLVISLFIVNEAYSQWEHMINGMGSVAVYSVVSQNNKLFASSQSQLIYTSSDNGVNWTFTSYLTGRPAYSLAVNNKRIFAGSDSDGVYLSPNSGVTWTKSSLNEVIPFYSIGVNEENIFAGTANQGIYASYDNGITWNQTSLNNITVKCIAVSGNTVFAGTAGTGIYISNDNGLTWTQSSLNNINVYSIAISGNNIYATGYSNSAVYWSSDNGLNWTNIGLSGHNLKPILLYTDNVNNYIIVGTGGDGFFISANNGASWVQKNEGFTPGNVNTMCFANNYIFAGTAGQGVYRRYVPDMLGIKTVSNEVPEQYSLSQNYPNPFNPVTKIRFDIAGNSDAKIIIYDITGREVITLVNENLSPGKYEVEWNASNFSSGVYYYTLKVDAPATGSTGYSETRKMVLVK